MTLVAFDVATNVVLVCTMFRADDLFLRDLDVYKVSH
jgi:hypothetical protein